MVLRFQKKKVCVYTFFSLFCVFKDLFTHNFLLHFVCVQTLGLSSGSHRTNSESPFSLSISLNVVRFGGLTEPSCQDSFIFFFLED